MTPATAQPLPMDSSCSSSGSPTSPPEATAAVGPNILEDVALARNIKRGKNNIRLRYAPEAVAARMYPPHQP